MIKNNFFIKLMALCISASGFSQTVSSVSELQSALDNAIAGTIITIEDGNYTDADLEIEAIGTATEPIIIQAETSGGVIFEDNCRIKMGGEYITLTGVVFTGEYSLDEEGPDSYVISFKNDSECSNCKLTQVQIDDYNPSSDTYDLRWIRVYGQDNEISYNTFINKSSIGSMLFNQREDGMEDRMKIHHNYFANRTLVGDVDDYNDVDVMRIGDSTMSLTDSSSEVYNNYFYAVRGGEPEIIANKSGNNKYYNNTFSEYFGALSLRHGNGCSVYNNFFLNSDSSEFPSYFNGGIRIIGEDHRVYNNYIQGSSAAKVYNSSDIAGGLGGINISATQEDNEQLSGYGPIKNLIVANNTIVDSDFGFRIGVDSGGSGQDEAPDDITVVNNLIVNCSIYVDVEREATNSVFEGNMYDTGTSDGTSIDGFSQESDLLSTSLVGGIYPIIESSPAINSSVGDYSSIFYDNLDVFAGERTGTYDVGAQEYGATIEKEPYTQADVGVVIGFGAGEDDTPILRASVSEADFDLQANTAALSITSNVDWEIEITDLDWVSLDATSGSGNGAVNLVISENTSGADRSGTITINETSGENDLSVTIIITQSNTFAPIELEIVDVTAVGTQTDDEGEIVNGPENSIDNNNITRWSAESGDGSAYITYDLGCIKELTEIQILFFNSSERTTQFILATSEDGESFTDINSAPISSTLQTSFESFDLGGVEAQYVRIYGYGNSDEGSDWNSITEVDIYGYDACLDISLSVVDNDLQTLGVQLYPVPVINGELFINSPDYSLNEIEIYSMAGKKVISTEVNNENNASVITNELAPGIYFIVLEGIGVGKFIVQ